MNGPRHHLLTGSAFAQDQYGVGALCRLGDDPVELLHFRRSPYNAAETLLRLDLLPEHAVFGFEFQMRRNPLQQQPEFLHTERLSDVIVSAILHGLHRGLNCAVASDDNDDDVGSSLPNLVQSFQTPGSWQLQIEQNDIDGIALKHTISVLGGVSD